MTLQIVRKAASAKPQFQPDKAALEGCEGTLDDTTMRYSWGMLELLKRRLGEDKVSTSPSVRDIHGKDEGYPKTARPEAVVFANELEDIQTALAFARKYGLSVIPYGTGTSLEGHLLPIGPTISLDLSRMHTVIEVRPEDFVAVVQPGLHRKALNEKLRRYGLFFPVDPGADASLGGMAATNASGTTTVRYGGMRHNVLALEVVLASGEVLHLGREVMKTSSAYDLKDLFIGSEGTLGVITRLSLKLSPLPGHVHALRVFFPSLEQAAKGAYSIMSAALPVARLELVDSLGLKAVNRYLGRDFPEQPALFLEFHASTEASAQEEQHFALELLREAGAGRVDSARTPEERTVQWEARHQAYWALVSLYPGRKYVITDTAVPLSKMPQLVGHAQALLKKHALSGSILGHVGDGNFHSLIAVSQQDYDRAEAVSMELVERALSMGGTASGEHGVGLHKMRYMEKEHGSAVNWMRKLKGLFDPDGTLNPGKIV